MPHLFLEYSANISQKIDPEALFGPCHQILAQDIGADILLCQSRLLKLDHYYVGDGDPLHAFVSLQITLKEGRPPEMISKAGTNLIAHLNHYFTKSSDKLLLQIAVHFLPFPNSLYFKSDPKFH
jgi:5-carboxymethyl-2-hydroxymuconate isomerase